MRDNCSFCFREAADDAVVSSPGTATPLLLTRAANRLAALQSGTTSRQSSSRLTREDTVDPPPQQQVGSLSIITEPHADLSYWSQIVTDLQMCRESCEWKLEKLDEAPKL